MKPNLRAGYIIFDRKDNKKIKISYISILILIMAMLMLIPVLENTISSFIDYSNINTTIQGSNIKINIQSSDVKTEFVDKEEEIDEDSK